MMLRAWRTRWASRTRSSSTRPSAARLGEGKDEAFLQMLSIMKPAKKKIKNAVNIIGPTFSTFNWRADVFELKRMLSGIGVKVNAVMYRRRNDRGAEKSAAGSAQPVHLPVRLRAKSCGRDGETL